MVVFLLSFFNIFIYIYIFIYFLYTVLWLSVNIVWFRILGPLFNLLPLGSVDHILSFGVRPCDFTFLTSTIHCGFHFTMCLAVHTLLCNFQRCVSLVFAWRFQKHTSLRLQLILSLTPSFVFIFFSLFFFFFFSLTIVHFLAVIFSICPWVHGHAFWYHSNLPWNSLSMFIFHYPVLAEVCERVCGGRVGVLERREREPFSLDYIA